MCKIPHIIMEKLFIFDGNLLNIPIYLADRTAKSLEAL